MELRENLVVLAGTAAALAAFMAPFLVWPEGETAWQVSFFGVAPVLVCTLGWFSDQHRS